MNPGDPHSPVISPDQAPGILAMLRDARALVYRDAESFDQAAAMLEHVGQVLAREVRNGLGQYEGEILGLAGQAPGTDARRLRELFRTVRETRNDSVHSGAFIRHHVLHLVELLLILEEALSMNGRNAGDLMVRNPVVAELWHNIAAIRRTMLTNSFTYLPAQTPSGEWKLVSDIAIVQYLGGHTSAERGRAQGRQLGEIVQTNDIVLTPCRSVSESAPISEVRNCMVDAANQHSAYPVLVTEMIDGNVRLVGILTAFDML